MPQKNEYDFTALVGKLLTRGWSWVHGPPSEEQLRQWLVIGRAEAVLGRQRRTTDGLVQHRLTLLRAKHESAPLKYDRRVAYVGEWSAWEVVKNPYRNPWTIKDIECRI